MPRMALFTFEDVPLDMARNAQFRFDIREAARRDSKMQQALMELCRNDVLFWMSTFCWLYEPRVRYDDDGKLLPKQVPFLPWDHQIPLIRALEKHLGVCDIGVEKSRGEGASWIAILMALHAWLFGDQDKIGLVSNTELKTDDPGNLDSLMAKLDWELERLPLWMAGEKGRDWTRTVTSHAFVSKRNGCQINGFAATKEAGRAGRYSWFLCDELAFWDRPKDSDFINGIRDATDSRLIVSTPNGNDGEYYKLLHTPSNMVKLQLHWSQNRTKNRGLYRYVDGKIMPVNPVDNPLGEAYAKPGKELLDMYSRLRTKGFRLEGRLRSAWYDNVCDRADSTPYKIAQELDLDYGGTMCKVFTGDFMASVERTVRQPYKRGTMTYNQESLKPEFVSEIAGELKLWVPLDANNRPPAHPFVLGCDISTGLGGSYTSNSTIVGFDMVTREQVLEISQNTILPSDWADLAMAIGYWLNGAYLAWEQNGPGNAFCRRVIDKGYPNAYRRTVLWRASSKTGKEYGWWSDAKSREALFMEFIRSVRNGEITVRSEDLVKECSQYIRSGPTSRIMHVATSNTDDAGSKGEAHGDLVIGCGVAIIAMKERPLVSADNLGVRGGISGPPPRNTMAYREWERNQAKADAADDWDHRSNWDMASGGAHSYYMDD